MSDDQIDLATKIAGPATQYPSAYDEVREIWLEFIGDRSKGTNEYITAVTNHVKTLAKYDVPMDDRSDVIIAGFWAASAEKVINERAGVAIESERTIRTALERVWDSVDEVDEEG